MIPVKTRKKYYQIFFNENLFREFRILNENKIKNKRYFLTENNDKKKSFLLSQVLSNDKTGNYNIYNEIYPFKNFEELQKNKKQLKIKKDKKLFDFSNNKPIRLYDRLYFDFDFDKNPIASKLKEKINLTILKNDKSNKKELITEYHSLLFDKKLAKKPLEELKQVTNYLNNKNILSYPIFSGSKGFHLYIFFQKTLLNPESFNNVAYQIFETFKTTLELKTLDKAVFENPSQRIARLPYCKHPITELHCYPIDINDSYTNIIENSFKPKIKQFDIDEHMNNKGNTELLDLITNRSEMENKTIAKGKEKDKQIKELHKKNSLLKTKKYEKSSKRLKEVEKDCIQIANEFLGTPNRSYGDYVTYQCPFHNDTQPSLSVYQERFYCAVCGYKLNYLGFIMKYYGVDEKEGIKILLKHF